MIKIIGVILLMVGIIAGVYLVNTGNLQLFSRADNQHLPTDQFPTDAIISNITDTSFTVSYFTPKKKVPSAVFFSKDGQELFVAGDDRGNEERFTHHVTISGLEPNTEYYLLIKGDDGNRYPTNDYIKQKTANTLTGSAGNKTFSGSAKNDGAATSAEALVYFKTDKAQILSTIVDSAGTWKFDQSKLRTKNLDNFYSIAQVDPIEILIVSGTEGVGYIRTLGLGQNKPLEINLETQRIPFFNVGFAGNNGVNVNTNQNSSNDGAQGNQENQGFFGAIWTFIKNFFTRS